MDDAGQMIYNDKDRNPTALRKGNRGDLLMQWEDNDGNPIPAWKEVSIPAAQVQSNWTQTNSASIDYIKNKPTIPAAQIQSDWTQASTDSFDYIKNLSLIHI